MNECMLDRQTAGCVVEKIVLPQIVSIKQASEIMKLPPYYLSCCQTMYHYYYFRILRSFLSPWRIRQLLL